MSSWQSAARSRHSTEQPPQLDTLNVPISNPTKVLYPSGYTKTQIIDYYIQVAPFILPHIRDRPVTMKRYPDGVRGEFFYEKNAPTFTPAWVQTFTVVRKSGGQIRYILLNDARTLVWAANLANLVAQVEFAEWTENDHLRHARFVGLRDDKEAMSATREGS